MPPAVPVIAAGLGLAGTLANASAAKKQAKATERAAAENTKAAQAAAEAAGKPQEIHQTTEEILHKSPVEIGATGAQGFDLANQWAQMMAMAMGSANSGGMFGDFGAGAKSTGQYVTQGFDKLSSMGEGADKEAEYASYDLQRKARQAQDVKLKVFGIDNGTGANPGGVKLSFDDFVQLRRAKDPAGLVQQGISVNDPIQDNEWGAVSSLMAKGDTNPVWQSRYQFLDMLANDPQLGGDGFTAMEADPRWKDAIAHWKAQGVISSSNMVNQGQLQKQNDALIKATMENRTMTAMNPDMERALRDEYNSLSSKVVDPKMIKQTDMGEGVMKTEMLNADGTVASSFLEGSIRLPSGQVMRNVEVSGSSLSDWDNMQSIAAKTGGLFDGKKSAAAGAYSSQPKSSSSSKPKAPEGYSGAALSQESVASAQPASGGMDMDALSQILLSMFLPMLGGAGGQAPSGASSGASSGSPGPSVAPPGYDVAPSSASRSSASSARRSGPPTTSMPDPMMY